MVRLLIGIVVPPALAYAWAYCGTSGMRYRYRPDYVAFPFWICTGLFACVGVVVIAQVARRRWPMSSLLLLLAIFVAWGILGLALFGLCIEPQFSPGPGS